MHRKLPEMTALPSMHRRSRLSRGVLRRWNRPLVRWALMIVICLVVPAQGQMPGDDGNGPYSTGQIFGLVWLADGLPIGRSYAHLPTRWGIVRDLEVHAFSRHAPSQLRETKRIEIDLDLRTRAVEFDEMGSGTRFGFNARTFRMESSPAILRHAPSKGRFLLALKLRDADRTARQYYASLAFDAQGRPTVDWYVDYRDVHDVRRRTPGKHSSADDRRWEVRPEGKTTLVPKPIALAYRLTPHPE